LHSLKRNPFVEHLKIERVAGEVDDSNWLLGYAVYLMTRRSNGTGQEQQDWPPG
jgi:hypothetical protein